MVCSVVTLARVVGPSLLGVLAASCSDLGRDHDVPGAVTVPAQAPEVAAASPASLHRSLRVVDGDTLVLDGVRHRLFGIDAPERDATCLARADVRWRCGDAATRRLQDLVNDARVTCDVVAGQRDDFGRKISRCRADRVDLGDALVRDGLAWAFRRYSDDYADAERVARRRGVGVWQAPNTPAWVERAQRRNANGAAGEPPDADCRIKGNISGSGRIYHLPGSRDYEATRISMARGERWFCSERQARAAGWRARR